VIRKPTMRRYQRPSEWTSLGSAWQISPITVPRPKRENHDQNPISASATQAQATMGNPIAPIVIETSESLIHLLSIKNPRIKGS
jgi:hypothetical protein